jgi:hypothetical protein
MPQLSASRSKAHKMWADGYASEGNALKAAAHYERAYGLLRFGADEECIICLESDATPIRSGCACRSDSGLAQRRDRGTKVWRECEVCKQPFTGAMRTGLAEAWWARGSPRRTIWPLLAKAMGHYGATPRSRARLRP